MYFIVDRLDTLQLEAERLMSEEPSSRQGMMAGSELNQMWRKRRKRQIAEVLMMFILWNLTHCLDIILGKGMIQG